MRVVERGDGARFLLEAVRVGAVQHLDGDRPAQPRVRRLVDLAHAAGAEWGDDLVQDPNACRLAASRLFLMLPRQQSGPVHQHDEGRRAAAANQLLHHKSLTVGDNIVALQYGNTRSRTFIVNSASGFPASNSGPIVVGTAINRRSADT